MSRQKSRREEESIFAYTNRKSQPAKSKAKKAGQKTCVTKEEAQKKKEEEEAAALDPARWYLRENLELEKVLAGSLKFQHVVFAQSGANETVFPSDMVMTRTLEQVPLSAFTSYFLAHNMSTIQMEFNTWKATDANAAIPMGIKAFNKLCYIVFLYNYERIVVRERVEEGAADTTKSLLQRIVSKYLDQTIIGVANMQQAVEKELADDCDVSLEVWLRNKKFSQIGIVDMTDVNPDLTVANVLSQLQMFGVRYDREVLSHGIPGMSDMAVISLILSSVATSVTTVQLDLINKTFGVDITKRISFNPVVNELVQQFKLSYVSNQANKRVGIFPATQ